MNNNLEDYEYLYEFITGAIEENAANEEKFRRLRERNFLTEDNKVNVTVVKCENYDMECFDGKIPQLPDDLKRRFADIAMESALACAAEYPEQLAEKMAALGIKMEVVDALALAEQAGSAKAVNIVLMGRLSKYFDFSEEEWMTAIEQSVPAKFLELNKKAFTLGRDA